jgi:hypothetical protein
MTPPIRRLRYFDGEYLRAFDFAAEQGYHVDMRRRLNMALHLYGIVEGLQLSSTTDAGITQVSVSPGMAIDSYGREVFLLAPYAFDDVADIQANRIVHDGNYQVWIQYVRVADTPPSVGYAACNVTDQTTRWRETFKIALLQSTSAGTPPAVTDDISEEDPDTDTSNGVYLGAVKVTLGSLTGVFTALLPPPPQPPVAYIGLRAQQIQPPNFPDTVSPAFDITQKGNSLAPPIGVNVPSNLFVDQNLIVGSNFLLDPKTIQPAPAPVAPAVFPSPSGNVKIAADLFLQGELYSLRPNNNPPPNSVWLSLGAYVKSFQPDVQTNTQTIMLVIPGTTPVTVGQTGSLTGSGTPIPLTPKLTQVDTSRVQVSVSISGVTYNAAYPGGNPYQAVSYSVSWLGSFGPGNLYTLTPTWSVGPLVAVAGNPSSSPISIINITYIVVFFPL